MGTVANMEIKKGINKPNVNSFFLNENAVFGNILFTKYISNKVFYKNIIRKLTWFCQNYYLKMSNVLLKMYHFILSDFTN